MLSAPWQHALQPFWLKMETSRAHYAVTLLCSPSLGTSGPCLVSARCGDRARMVQAPSAKDLRIVIHGPIVPADRCRQERVSRFARHSTI